MPNLRYLHIGVLVSLCLEAASPWQPWSVPPRDVMADITNDLGICLLQVIGRESRDNIAFSPYGVMSIVFLLYEGSHGNTAIEIYNALRLPWDRHMSRIGFRDLHRHIKSYFSNDRFLRGLVLSKPSVPLKTEYVRLLNFYGFYPNGEPSGPPAVPPAESEGKGMPEDHDVHPTVAPSYIPPLPTTRRPTKPSSRPTPIPTTPENEYVTSETTTKEYITKPNLDEYTTNPSDYVTKPNLNEYTTEPSMGEYTARQTTKVKPSTDEYITNPSYNTRPNINEYTTKSATKDYTSKTTSTDFENNSFETEPTVPPYDPTKYPSKTTYYYNTKRKPMRTTTLPPYTYNDISTVKPGYNSHGMTQFFTDQTPTAPESKYTNSDDQTIIEDNIIFGNDPYQNGRPTTYRPTTNSGIYRPPKQGFTDPIYTQPENKYTTKQGTTAKETLPYGEEDNNEQPIYFPKDRPTTELNYHDYTSDERSTIQTTPTSEDRVVYPTSATDDSNDYIDIRSANLKSTTPPPSEIATHTIEPDTMSEIKGRSEESSFTLPANQETSGTTSSTETVTPYDKDYNGKIMTRKEVEEANQRVETINKTITENPETSSLATILMSVGYTNGAMTQEADIKLNITDLPITTEENVSLSENFQNYTLLNISQPIVLNQTSFQPEILNRTARLQPYTRSKRALIGPPVPYDHRDGSSNWIPPAEGPHWEYNVPRDQWFFTYYGSEPVPVLTYMDYLPFAFIESINTLALKLPLDDPRYSMLIMLPMERFGLDQLLAQLHQCSIREILQDLRVTPIYAVLPAFTLVKHINLVPALTAMGVEEVFDASRADLSGMATEPHLYVRSIEQLVTVSLRKYHYLNRRYDIRPEEVRHHFIANHPFAYFVLDSETNAALMAGTLVSPTAFKQKH